jgi:epoxyqueuosine reductase
LGDPEFAPRHGLDDSTLITLFAWSAEEFERRLAGNPIRRIGHERWLRNITVALGNGPNTVDAQNALKNRLDHPSTVVRSHIHWALERLGKGTKPGQINNP